MSAAATGASATASFPRLDKYELIEEIGHGGMATVYRARDPRLGREVAVKVIHRHLRENAEVGTRFVAEARASAKLRHPGIVDVFDVSNEDDPERYLVVELIRGTTLRRVLQQHRDMPAEVGAAIVRQLCEAVEHAHSLSIIHRDIKPENVLVELPQDRIACSSDPAAQTESAELGDSGARPPGSAAAGGAPRSDPLEIIADEPSSDTQSSARDAVTPHGLRARAGKPAHRGKDGARPRASPVDPGVIIKITDFGIAKLLDVQGVTSTGQVLGSPAHMAPEQIEGGDVDPRTDVFALGVLLYECLVGHLPFEGKNPAQVLRRVLEGEYPAADRERPSVGGRWTRVVAAALAHDPAERISSALQLAERIQVELSAVGVPDGKAEIAAYFADPPGYLAAHKARLVPRLAARGEAARKSGDVWGAAADWNRALALAPEDLTILKRMTSLTSSASRRQLVRRAAMILAGSAALGLGAFAVARTIKARGATHDPGPLTGPSVIDGATVPPTGATTSLAPEPPRHAPITTATATTFPVDTVARLPRVPATPTVGPSAPGGMGDPKTSTARDVGFEITPKGARLSIDGVPRESWFATVFRLSIGPHTVEMTPTDPRCCKKTGGNVVVDPPAPGKPDEPQRFHLSMALNPAAVSLAATAPPGARLTCQDIGLTVPAGSVVSHALREPEWQGTCFYSTPDRPRRPISVSLKAGETRIVPWPSN